MLVVQVYEFLVQCKPAPQSVSSQQPGLGKQTPDCGEQTPDWQISVAFTCVQPCCCTARPHRLLEPQTPDAHSAPALHCAPLSETHRLLTLHKPEAHAELNPPAHVSCNPSVGNDKPEDTFAVQVKVDLMQNSPEPQSSSTQHLPAPNGMQALVEPLAEGLQMPDWQVLAASATVQGDSPFCLPHAPPEHKLLRH